MNATKQSFQAGVDTLYNECKSRGATPSAKTPTAISAAIQTIYNDRYNTGRTQGQNDVKSNPNGYGLYSKSQYDQNYNNGYNAGKATVVDLGIISASSQSGSNTRDSTFSLTKYSGYKNIGTGNIVFMPMSWSNNGGMGKDMDNFQGPTVKSYNANTGIVTLAGASGTGYGWGASIASARFVIVL